MINGKTALLLWCVCVFIAGATVGAWFAGNVYGVSVDDSYIYFSYVRNLVNHHEIAYNHGETSFGATSMLWVLLLAGLQILTRGDLIVLAKFTGIFCHAISGVILLLLVFRQTRRKLPAGAAALFFVGNPFLMVSAASGLDTAMNLLLILSFLLMIHVWRFPLNLPTGIFLGILFWSRPENLLLAAFFLPVLVLKQEKTRANPWMTVRQTAWCLTGFLITAAPLSAYIYLHSGHIVPWTYKGQIYFFSPKFFTRNLPGRLETGYRVFVNLIRKLIFGKFKALLPAVLLFALSLKHIRHTRWIPGRWDFTAVITGYSILFLTVSVFMFPIAMWRYLLPLIPLFLLIGATVISEKTAAWKRRAGRWTPYHRHLRAMAVLILAGGLILTGTSLTTAVAKFRKDVRSTIDPAHPGPVLAATLWLRNHTPPETRIAAVGIGVPGYFSNRYLVDLGGLIDPAVWPALADSDPESAFQLLEDKQVQYIIHEDIRVWGTLPRYYPRCFEKIRSFPGARKSAHPLTILAFHPEKRDPGNGATADSGTLRTTGFLARVP